MGEEQERFHSVRRCERNENCGRGLKISRWNNLCRRKIMYAFTLMRLKITRASDVLSVWGTRIKRLDEYNLIGEIQFVLYVALLSKKIAGIKFV